MMRVGFVPVVPYARPDSAAVKPLTADIVADHSAALLENHGPIVSGPSLDATALAIEGLEESARLTIITRRLPVRHLSVAAIDDLNTTFPLR